MYNLKQTDLILIKIVHNRTPVVITSLAHWGLYVHKMRIVDTGLFACSMAKPIEKGMDPYI